MNHGIRASSLLLQFAAFWMGCFLTTPAHSQANAPVGGTIVIHYNFTLGSPTDSPGDLSVWIEDARTHHKFPAIQPQKSDSQWNFVYTDDGKFNTYHKDLILKLAWTKLPSNHRSALIFHGPVQIQIPVRLRNDQQTQLEISFMIYNDFSYKTSDELDQVINESATTTSDADQDATGLINAALATRLYASVGGGSIEANWARIWFDSALQLAETTTDVFQIGLDAYDTYKNTHSASESNNASTRYGEINSAFIRPDGIAFDAAIADHRCDQAKIILAQFQTIQREHSDYFTNARPNEQPGSYVAEKNRSYRNACG